MSKTSSNLLIAGLALAGAYALFRPRHRYEFAGKVVLITGGSRGLGLVMARLFAEAGARVAICARDEAELERARADIAKNGGEVFTGVCDVRDQAQVRRLIADVGRELGDVDVLINCAGVIQVGPIESQTQEDLENMMAVHFWGPYYMMDEVVPAMKRRGSGRIVNISSIGGRVAIPHLAPYCASKFALAGFSSAMTAELAKDNIAVTTVYPGLMRTGSHINAKFKGQHKAEFALFSLMDATPLTTTSAERSAAQILDACASGKAELIITIQAKIAAKFAALAPEVTASILGVTNQFLPGYGGIGTRSLPGSESTSLISPSPLTTLIDNAAVDNNET